ncbi:MAG: hypothetical protein JST78_06555 [Bacteroidetes bacterium]|nr:hypothetical protein [Bacteroidota bacterium]
MSKYVHQLSGGDLRSIAQANNVVATVNSQEEFDELFSELENPERKVVMRAADALEKISINHPEYVQKHKTNILALCQKATDKELKWHLALMVSRINLDDTEFEKIWTTLANWAMSQHESKIVRVNSIQGLYELLMRKPEWQQSFDSILTAVEKEPIASIKARIKKLKNVRK